MGVIIQLKKLFTGVQIFPKTKSMAVYDDDLGRLDTVIRNDLAQMSDPLEEFEDETEVRDADTVGGISPEEFAKKSDYNGIICVLVADNWVEQEDGTFKYTIAYPSLTGNEILDVDLYDEGSATEEQAVAFNELVTRIDVNEGEIVVGAIEKPTVSFSIILKGVCAISETNVVGLSEVIVKYDEVQSELEKLSNDLGKEAFLTSTQSTQYVDVNLDLSLYRSIRLEIANVTSGNNFILNNVTIDVDRFIRDCNSDTSFLGCYAYTTSAICGRAYYVSGNTIRIYINTEGFETKLYGIK